MSDKNEFPINDSTFLLSSFGILATCISGFLAFVLKSRSREISCLGIRCVRDVLPPDVIGQLEQGRRDRVTELTNPEVISRT